MEDRAANAAPRPGWIGLALGVILLPAGCLPAVAQNLFLPARLAAPSTPSFSVRLQLPPASAPSRADRLTINVPADYNANRLISTADSAMDYVETSFVQHTFVPLARFARGHFELGGFDTLRPVENELLGPPHSGSLAAWGVSTQVHPGIWAPEADESYGLSLSIHLKRDPQPEHHAQILRCLGWIVGRGCHLN